MLRWRQHAKLLIFCDGETAILWVLDGYVVTRVNTCVHSSAASSIQADLHALHTAPGKNSGSHLECSMLGLCFVCQDSMLYCSRSTWLLHGSPVLLLTISVMSFLIMREEVDQGAG